MSENPRPSDNRALAWFFSHFFYLSALIVTLQGELHSCDKSINNESMILNSKTAVAALLVFGVSLAQYLRNFCLTSLLQNVGVALHLPLDMISEIGRLLVESPGRPLDKSGVSSLERPLFKIGVSLDTIVNYVNTGVRMGEATNDSSIAYNFLLQQSVETVSVILQASRISDLRNVSD
jgi:hypothetical protein